MALPLNIDLRQILLHLFNFAILSGGLYFLLYSPVKKFMDERERSFREKTETADEKLRHAEELEASAICGEKIAEAEARAEEIVAAAKAEGEREKRAIIDGAGEEIERLAIETTEKLLSETTYDSFISYALSEKRKERAGAVGEPQDGG
ncbi:MAG: hypothetical protein LUD43_02550 [Firmicutes bacterium]|nr:hypothetical protein [Bacillota bacterium]